MKRVRIALAAAVLAGMMACGRRTISSGVATTELQVVDLTTIHVDDSSAMRRHIIASLQHPRIVIVRRQGGTDTAIVTIEAEEIVIGDSMSVGRRAVATLSDSLAVKAKAESESREEPMSGTKSRTWLFVLAAVLGAVIALSWRGTGSRR